jgi:hypothetical protein
MLLILPLKAFAPSGTIPSMVATVWLLLVVMILTLSPVSKVGKFGLNTIEPFFTPTSTVISPVSPNAGEQAEAGGQKTFEQSSSDDPCIR